MPKFLVNTSYEAIKYVAFKLPDAVGGYGKSNQESVPILKRSAP